VKAALLERETSNNKTLSLVSSFRETMDHIFLTAQRLTILRLNEKERGKRMAFWHFHVAVGILVSSIENCHWECLGRLTNHADGK
jgi:hypothetical protein